MKTKSLYFLLAVLYFSNAFSQRLLMSWSQQNIENYTLEMYNSAQKLTAAELLEKNIKDEYWSEVFLTLNASVNNYSKDRTYLEALCNQLTNKTETKLKGTSRLIIWDRIITGDIIFEGKGLVMSNDLFTVAGRANQLLQSLTNKNFGYVAPTTSLAELKTLQKKWKDFLEEKPVEEFKPIEYKNGKIEEICSLTAVEAFVISLQDNQQKSEITKKCLKNVYKLDELPKEKDSPAQYCNPDTYTFGYLNMLFGFDPKEERNAQWWLTFWKQNHSSFTWNPEKGIYVVK